MSVHSKVCLLLVEGELCKLELLTVNHSHIKWHWICRNRQSVSASQSVSTVNS